jgi:hypothetical protein
MGRPIKWNNCYQVFHAWCMGDLTRTQILCNKHASLKRNNPLRAEMLDHALELINEYENHLDIINSGILLKAAARVKADARSLRANKNKQEETTN